MASLSELTKAGLEGLGDDPGPLEVRLVKAVAKMLAVAGGRKKKGTDETKLAVSPAALFKAISEGCPDRVLCSPIDNRWFGRLGGVLKSFADFGPNDVEILVAWFNAGGQSSWPQGVPTFDHLILNLGKWTAFARQWDARGRQDLHRRGAGSVGLPSAGDQTDWSAFGTKGRL